jgi:DNA mismatch endonuclease (patch repair protein)
MTRWPGNAQVEKTSFGGLDRSRLMSRVRSFGNKTTEKRMVTLLRRAGLSGWRRHLRIAGRPDFAWPNQRVAVFVDGCFWHGHDCGKNITPRTNAKAWAEKIAGNRARDRRVTRELRATGWAVVRIWECRLKQRPQRCMASLASKLALAD